MTFLNMQNETRKNILNDLKGSSWLFSQTTIDTYSSGGVVFSGFKVLRNL